MERSQMLEPSIPKPYFIELFPIRAVTEDFSADLCLYNQSGQFITYADKVHESETLQQAVERVMQEGFGISQIVKFNTSTQPRDSALNRTGQRLPRHRVYVEIPYTSPINCKAPFVAMTEWTIKPFVVINDIATYKFRFQWMAGAIWESLRLTFQFVKLTNEQKLEVERIVNRFYEHAAEDDNKFGGHLDYAEDPQWSKNDLGDKMELYMDMGDLEESALRELLHSFENKDLPIVKVVASE